MTPDKTPERPQRRSSRLRSAWQALKGEPVVPDAIRAEWVAWQFEFEAVLDKLSAAAARLYTRDKVALKAALKRLQELEDDVPQDGTGTASTPIAGSWNPLKVELSRRVLAMRGQRVPTFIHNGGENDVPGPEGE